MPVQRFEAAENKNQLFTDIARLMVAEYITGLPDKKLLQQKLHAVIEAEQERLENG